MGFPHILLAVPSQNLFECFRWLRGPGLKSHSELSKFWSEPTIPPLAQNELSTWKKAGGYEENFDGNPPESVLWQEFWRLFESR